MSNRVTIQKEHSSWRVLSQSVLRKLIRRTERVLQLPATREIAVAFVGDTAMRKLNSRYRGKQKTTDVLSFCYQKTKKSLSGDIVISLPQARRQARMIGNTLKEEMRFLFLHGFLHLLGYDHERSKKEERKMFALQYTILGRKK